MLLEMWTAAQADRAVRAAGCWRLPVEKSGSPSREIDVNGDLEVHWSAIEAVSVLFKIWGDDRNQRPSCWTTTTTKFELAWPKDLSVVRSHFGARRKAKLYNWNRALAHLIADLDAKELNPWHGGVARSTAALRRQWNHENADIAPWWADGSKRCYISRTDDIVEVLDNWSKSNRGNCKERKVGFPRFEPARRSNPNQAFCTAGATCLADGRRKVTLPGMRVRVDLGLRTPAVVVGTDDNIIEPSNPAPLRSILSRRRKAGRRLSRRTPGSSGHRRARTKLARFDRRVVHLRQDSMAQAHP